MTESVRSSITERYVRRTFNPSNQRVLSRGGAQLTPAAGLSTGQGIALQLGLLAGQHIINRFFKKRTRINVAPPGPQNVAIKWDPNAAAQIIIGKKVRAGGKVLFAYKEEGHLHLAVHVTQGATHPPPEFYIWLNGRRIKLIRIPNEVDATRPSHYEPTGTQYGFQGCIRIYWNGRADGTEGAELERATSPTTQAEFDRNERIYGRSRPWRQATHRLHGMTWFHVILNFSKRGIALPGTVRQANTPIGTLHNLDDINANNQLKGNSKKDTNVTGIPNLTFELPTGISLPALGTARKGFGANNAAQAIHYLLKTLTGLGDDDIDAAQAAAAASYIETQRRNYIDPMAFNGVTDFNHDPLRLIQIFETITNGDAAYENGKLVLLPGRHLSGNDIRGTITGKDLMSQQRVRTTINVAQRYNVCRFKMETCAQSQYNGTIQIADVVDEALGNRDREAIIEELQPAQYVNDYTQAQQIARTRARLYASRQPILIELPYTKEYNSWRLGQGFNMLLPDSGIDEARTYRIIAKVKKPNYSLAFEAVLQPEQDAWAIGEAASYDAFSEVPGDDVLLAQLPAITFVDQPDPIGTWYERQDNKFTKTGQYRSFIRYWYESLQRENTIIEGRWKPLNAAGQPEGEWIESTTTEPASQGVAWISDIDPLTDIIIQARFRDEDGQTGPWSPEEPQKIPIVRATPVPPNVARAYDIPALDYATLFWPVPPPDFVPFLKHTHVEWGSLAEDGTYTKLGETNDENNVHRITGLQANSRYRARIAYVNTDDIKGAILNHDFTTNKEQEDAGIYFDVPSAYVGQFLEGETINVQLPAAQGADNITYTLEGDLPEGIAFVAATRHLTGTVAEGARKLYQPILKAVNDDDATDTASVSVPINIVDDQEIAPISITPGDTTINAQAGSNVLVPAQPSLPHATGGKPGSTLQYSTAGLPNWLEVETDPDAALFAFVKIKDGQTVPENDPLAGRPQSFRWIITDGTTTEFVPIIFVIYPKAFKVTQPIWRLTADDDQPALNNGGNAAAVRANRLNENFVPDGWTDNEPSTTQGQPYKWKATREKQSDAAAYSDFSDIQLIEFGGEAVQPITWTPGDTTINMTAGGNVLDPAAPGLPHATGGIKGTTLQYSTARLPNFLEVATDPDAALFGRVRIRAGQTIPQNDPLTGRPQDFHWIVTDGTTTVFQPIIYVIYPETAATQRPPKPTGVDHDQLTTDEVRVFWTSSGDFYTEVEWEFFLGAAWRKGDTILTSGQQARIYLPTEGLLFRIAVRHVNSVGPGPYFDFP